MDSFAGGHSTRRMAVLALALTSVACSPWRRVGRGSGWSLYALDAKSVEIAPYREVFAPAHRAVERHFGPFAESVRVHLWPSSPPSGAVGRNTEVQRIPGIGPARIPAWHLRRGGGPIMPAGLSELRRFWEE